MSDKEREKLIESTRKYANEANMKIYTLTNMLDEVEAKNRSLNADVDRLSQQLSLVKDELRIVLSENIKANIITITATNGDQTVAEREKNSQDRA
ncbi:MAG: hypothetical protein ABR515_04090 [Nitrososphaeraceae archaeon]